MQDLNKFVVIGRLTRTLGEDEKNFGYIGNDTAKANISIAVNSSIKKGDAYEAYVSYFDIQIFGKTAENLKPYLTKGTQVAVEAHLKQDRWQKDGQNRSAISIIADHIELIGGKKDGGTSSASSAPTSAPQQQGFDPSEGFPDSIPF